MSDEASIFQVVQIAPEAVPGTAVAADTLLQSMSFMPSVRGEVQNFRASGRKFLNLGALGKEWSGGGIEGIGDYNEIVYALSSILKKVTPVGAGTAKTWTFAPAMNAADIVQTYSIERGSATRAFKMAYGLVTSLGIDFSRSGVNLSGDFLGRSITDDVALTGGATSPAQKPMLGKDISVYLADTAAGLDAASPLARALAGNWSIGNRFGPLWAMNKINDSFVTHIETVPDMSAKITVEADDEGMALLDTMRSGDKKFIRFEIVSDDLAEAGSPFSFKVDMCGIVQQPSDYRDQDGVFAIEWTLNGAEDATWGKAVEAEVVNVLTAL